MMGALSALVVGACMTAPLFAVLAFIAHTGRRGARRRCAVFDGRRARRAASDHRAWRRRTAAARGCVDGRRKGLLRRRAAGARRCGSCGRCSAASARMLLGALWLLIAAAALGLFAAGYRDAVRSGGGSAAASAPRSPSGRRRCSSGLAAGSTDPLRPLAVFAARGGEGGTSSTPNTAAEIRRSRRCARRRNSISPSKPPRGRRCSISTRTGASPARRWSI